MSGDAAEAVTSAPAAFDFDGAFRSNYERIARVIVRVLGDPARAEDLAVEAFWRLWRTPNAHGDAHAGWVYRTAIRLALDDLRRRARRERYERVLTVFRGPRTPDELYAATEEQRRVRGVLAAISRQHAVMLLLHSDGAPYEEIAAAASVSPSSVGALLARARQAFRKEYVRRHGERS
jgi:RNA polymerase sigma-70 factor (ECF subfamily)